MGYFFRDTILDLPGVDPSTGYQYCIAYLDQGKYVLNLIDNQVLNNTDIAETLTLKRCYEATELKLE